MKLLPSIARVRIASPERTWPTLWLPLFLIWPLVLLGLLLVWFGFVGWASLRRPAEATRVWPFIAGCYVFVCELKGTCVDVSGPRSHVFIAIS